MLTKFLPQAFPSPKEGSLIAEDLDPRLTVHYGIPSTASVLAFDPVQRLLAVGTLDGRIKVIGGDNIEGLLVSPKQLPFKNLEFLQNQGFLVSVSSENEIQVWDLEHRRINSTLRWESNITAFSVIYSTSYMYLGDEYGMVSVLKYDAEEGKLTILPYYVPTDVIAEGAGISSSNQSSVVGVLPQPCSQGKRQGKPYLEVSHLFQIFNTMSLILVISLLEANLVSFWRKRFSDLKGIWIRYWDLANERLLIAYDNGWIVLWDVSEDKVVLVRGNKDLQLKGETVVHSSQSVRPELSENLQDSEQAEKEISALCWASTDGSVLAVGYVDGDIMFWNLPTDASTKDHKAENSSNNVVKLQLSSADKRLPVIVLHWSADKSHNGGQLFVYGGDRIGSEEVLTILCLDWSSGIEGLKCVGRVDLTLSGSFADMVLLPSLGGMESCGSLLFVLTNPGQLYVYDDACLSSLMSRKEKRTCASSLQYPMVIPTIEPRITVGKLSLVYRHGKFSRDLSKEVSAAKVQALHTPSATLTGNTKWPLTGGVPYQFNDAEDYLVEKLYVAGYQDGSVRIWDATYPALSLVYVLGSELAGFKTASASAPVSALEFCSFSLSLAIGNACGMISLYKLIRSSNETSLNFVTEAGKEVHVLPQGDGPQCMAVFSFLNYRTNEYEPAIAVGNICVHVLPQGDGPQCMAVFSFLNSRICNLQFADFGGRLAVGFECGRVAMLDISTLSVLFLTDSISDSSSPVISLAVKSFSDTNSVVNNGGNLFSDMSIDKHSLSSPQNSEAKTESAQTTTNNKNIPLAAELEPSIETTYFGQRLNDLFVLLCCEDSLWLYSLKSLIQGDSNSFQKVNLSKPCCWTTTFKKNERECGLVVLYRSDLIEIRSLPNLEVVGETSLTSILRWNFKTNMETTISSSDSGQIVLINGCEFAFLSLLAYENDLRFLSLSLSPPISSPYVSVIPESLPCLHDKVVAAAAEATINLSPSQKKAEDTAPGILSGIVKGFKAGKVEQKVDLLEISNSTCAHLDHLFSYPPFLKPSTDVKDDHDIVIDGPLVVSSSSQSSKNDEKDKRTEKERLFEGAPKTRTIDEIKAKYRKSGDASSAALEAKNKLAERQEKLEKLRDRTEELQSGAESFADMANELVKNMEKRKWWHI
ncbi:hypothetical protein JRO89_XS14G0111900 [Xanthoceras sorbifolium]|uniref:V-SNARE coiled-coil homology domain-containing protein n=1 Tax=Xanthoceras sorbifolium TaxID=99658 RepID=A0ABQ8H535_9ROSI|nr:hypothetical protein JRO89_XS14G0111900 [Xanthoceras sorbifolium]